MRFHGSVLVLGSQVCSSLSNLVGAALVASSANSGEFDSYSEVFIIYSLLLGVARALFGDSALSVAVQKGQDEIQRGVDLRGLLYAPLSAVAVSLLGLSAVVLGYAANEFLVMLLVGLPLLILQEVVRYIAFAARRPGIAFGSDCCWFVLLLAFWFFHTALGSSAIIAFGAWIATGAVSAALSTTLLFKLVTHASDGKWSVSHARRGLGFAVEFLAGGGLGLIAIFVLGIAFGADIVGDVRGGQIITAPLNVVFTASLVVITSDLGRRIGVQRTGDLARPIVTFSLVGLATPAIYSWLVLAIPSDIGQGLLGDNWSRSQETGVMLALAMAGLGVTLVLTSVLRAAGHAGSAARARLGSAPIGFVATIAGGAIGGTPGACVGIAMGNAATAMAYMFFVRKMLRSLR